MQVFQAKPIYDDTGRDHWFAAGGPMVEFPGNNFYFPNYDPKPFYSFAFGSFLSELEEEYSFHVNEPEFWAHDCTWDNHADESMTIFWF